jgi:transcriptional regulator GlxA family with amidase domain
MIEFVIFEGFSLIELASAMEIFRLCGLSCPDWGFRMRVVSDSLSIRSDLGLSVPAELFDSREEAPDMMVLIGPLEPPFGRSAVLKLLGQRAEKARRLVALSSAVPILSHFEVARGRNYVLHWQSEATFDTLGKPDRNRLFLIDGPVCTAASAQACTDMLLTLLAIDFGMDAVRDIARALTLRDIRSDQSPQDSPLLALVSSDELFTRLHEHVRRNLTPEFSTEVMAEFCGMSERTFLRRYKEAFGVSPARAVTRIRTHAAAELLSTGNFSPKRVARLCGFGSEATMRRSFDREFGASPRQFQPAKPAEARPGRR